MYRVMNNDEARTIDAAIDQLLDALEAGDYSKVTSAWSELDKEVGNDFSPSVRRSVMLRIADRIEQGPVDLMKLPAAGIWSFLTNLSPHPLPATLFLGRLTAEQFPPAIQLTAITCIQTASIRSQGEASDCLHAAAVFPALCRATRSSREPQVAVLAAKVIEELLGQGMEIAHDILDLLENLETSPDAALILIASVQPIGGVLRCRERTEQILAGLIGHEHLPIAFGAATLLPQFVIPLTMTEDDLLVAEEVAKSVPYFEGNLDLGTSLARKTLAAKMAESLRLGDIYRIAVMLRLRQEVHRLQP